MMCFSSFFAIIWQKMKKNMSWKFTDESSVTFQSSVSGPGEFGQGTYLQTDFQLPIQIDRYFASWLFVLKMIPSSSIIYNSN